MKVYNSLDRKSDLWKSLEKAKDELKVNPTKGDKIEKRLWPEKYIKKYDINKPF